MKGLLIWHYSWTSPDRRLITVREQRGKISVLKMFEDTLKINLRPPRTLGY